MKYVLFYEAADDFRSKVPAHFEAHRALWAEYGSAGSLLMIGPFNDAAGSAAAMAIFTTRDAAERFAKADPFVVHGLVARFTIREWNEALVP